MDQTLEQVRRFAHAALPKAVRNAGWTVLNLVSCVRALGLGAGIRLMSLEKRAANTGECEFTVNGHPFWVRNGTSDAQVLIQSVFRDAYLPWIPSGLSPKWILDLGANIGDSAVWFLARFPTARVIAVEPEPGNYAMAVRNLAGYGDRALVIHAAVWATDGQMKVRTADWNHAGAEVGEKGDVDCPTVSIPTLLARYGIPHVDIFKCDIEGAEAPIFGGDASWLAEVDHLCIELHDANCRTVVRRATAAAGFSERINREVHVFRRTW